LKGLDNLEKVQKARKERLYPEERGCEKVFVADHYNFRAQRLGINIDVFLELLMQEMETLWKHGMKMWDELAKSSFVSIEERMLF
jgi:hypothetical protein